MAHSSDTSRNTQPQGRSEKARRAPRKQTALRDQPALKKITIYVDRMLDAMLDSACTNRQLITSEGAHVHTKSALIGEILAHEFAASYQEFGDYVPTVERLRQQGRVPIETADPSLSAPSRTRVDLPPLYRASGRPGAKKRDE